MKYFPKFGHICVSHYMYIDAKSLTLSEQNKMVAQQWHGLSDDDKS